MTDKVLNIREEVERLKSNLIHGACSSQVAMETRCKEEAYNEILAILDSLQEESVNIWHDASEKPERDDLLIETNDGRIIHRQSINNYGMVKRWAYASDLLNLDNSCNFGKNLQEESVSEELVDAANNYGVNARKGYPRVMDETDRYIYNAFKAGANWQKQQMMAKAVEVTVHIEAGNYPYIPQLELYDYDKDVPLAKEGDKYKVVLIKED